MTTKQLRQAVARQYPDRYSRWSWKHLLADFIELHLNAYIKKATEAIANNQPVPPIPEELQAAAPLREKQLGRTYGELALSCYLLHIQLITARQERDHLKEQADRMHGVAIRSQQVAEDSITLLGNLTNSDPDSRPN